MATADHRHRPLRLLATVSGSLTLALALVVAASLSSPGGALAGTQAVAGAPAVAPGGTWGTAEEVPGTAALNKGGDAVILSVSCARAGSCSAGGFYRDASGRQQVFVAGEVKDVWGRAEQLPGIVALNRGGSAEISSVSCARPGDCSAGGFYTDASGNSHAFVAGEVKGIWEIAAEVPGIAALGVDAQITSVSCARAGYCSAGGTYTDASDSVQAFVAGEVKGIWGRAEELPGTAALNRGGSARITSVSCARAGDCSAGGFYEDASGRQPVFVAGEVKGIWGRAEQVPGIAALNRGGSAVIFSVSCARAGECSAGGVYADASFRSQAFVVNET